MEKTFTATGNAVVSAPFGDWIGVAMAGNAEDFTWAIEFSIDGSTWKPYSDTTGEKEFTGSDVRWVKAGAKFSRVVVTGMGAATSIKAAAQNSGK